MLRLALPRRAAPRALLLALRREHPAHAVQQHAHQPEPHRHGDVLQGGARRPRALAGADVGPVRVRARDHGAAREARRSHLRGPDLVRGSHLFRRQEDQLEGRRRRLLAHPEVQSAGMTDHTRRWLLPTSVAILALAACITSIGHDFTYDDRYVILMNERVHSLHRFWRYFAQSYWPPKYGGDGYRPMVILTFAVEWVLGHGAAWVFHLTNIILTVATALAVYWMALALLPAAGAWLAAALFAVHPLHVEVTGNMVGQAELLVGLSLVVAMGWYLRRRREGEVRTRDVALISLLYAVGLFSKEHAAVFPGLLLAAEWTVVQDERPWRARLVAVRPLVLALIAVTLAYYLGRSQVQADLAGFAPYAAFRFLNMGEAARVGTMLHEFPRIAQLMLFPTRLSADYSPADVIIADGIGFSELPGILLVLCTVTLAIALRRRAPVASF